MRETSIATLRQILHAAARVLGCGSAQMAILDEDRRELVVRVAISNRDIPRLVAVEELLGLSADGVSIPIDVESSVLARAVREGRICVTTRFGELSGDLITEEQARQVDEVIGDHTFAVVPILGRSRTIGELIFEKPGHEEFTPADRDLLVAYADRVGAEIEAQALTDEVASLRSLGDTEAPPPVICLCDRGPGQGALVVTDGEGAGQTLAGSLGVPEAQGPIEAAASRAEASGRPVTLTIEGGKGRRALRMTLRALGFAPGRIIAVCEAADWREGLGAAAARARDQLSRVLASLDDAIFTVDAAGKIVDCNEAARKVLDLRSLEVAGRPIDDLLADERSRKRAATLAGKVTTDGFAEGEMRFSRAGASLAATVSILALADEHARFTGAVWRVRDLTERRRGDAERQRLRAKLLQSERLSALGEMASRIAHEVRNPLVSISAAAQVIEEDLPAGSGVLDDVRAISREARRLDAILSDFLLFARPRRLARKPIEIDRLLAETVEMVRAKAGTIRFSVGVAPASPIVARCDGDALRQVLWNLLLNAVEASPAEGRIACEARRRGDRVEIVIADEGPGVPPALRRRVFDPFFSSKARGTGLGLAVSRQIVEEHQGRIRIAAGRQGVGARVIVDLPA